MTFDPNQTRSDLFSRVYFFIICFCVIHFHTALFAFKGAEVAATHAKATCQGARWHHAGAFSGPSGPPEAGGPQTAHGCQTGRFLQTELSHREGRQHRDLHPRGPDEALRSILLLLLCPPPTTFPTSSSCATSSLLPAAIASHHSSVSTCRSCVRA